MYAFMFVTQHTYIFLTHIHTPGNLPRAGQNYDLSDALFAKEITQTRIPKKKVKKKKHLEISREQGKIAIHQMHYRDY